MNVASVQEVQRERDFYKRLLDLGRSPDLSSLLDEALSLMTELIGANLGYLAVFEPDPAYGRHMLQRGWNRDAGHHDVAGPGEISSGVIEAALRSREPVLMDSASLDPSFSSRESVRRLELEAVHCVPLFVVGESCPVGVLYLHRALMPGPYSMAAVQRVDDLARHLGPLMMRWREHRLRQRSDDPTAPWRVRLKLDELAGRSEGLAEVLRRVGMYAGLPDPVLISGPTGVGKNRIANALHANGPRRDQELVRIDLASLSPDLIQSELFGCVRGAFTGAQAREGRLRKANGGVVFLDEVGTLDARSQRALLTFFEKQVVIPVGGDQPVHVDARVIAATNEDLDDLVKSGAFREDLYQRLAVFRIDVPGLDERPEDVVEIAEVLLHRLALQGRPSLPLSPEARGVLTRADWSRGHARQLFNTLQRALAEAALEGTSAIEVRHLFRESVPEEDPRLWREAHRRFRRRFLVEALARHDGNQSATARDVGLSRSVLRGWLRELGLV